MKTIFAWIVTLATALSAVGMCSSVAHAQTGKWTIDANGFLGELDIEWIDSAGNLGGTAYGQPMFGFWDEDAKKITFMRVIDPYNPSSLQIFTGYMFVDPLFWAGNGGSTSYTLAGYFEGFAGTGASAKRSVWGWHAQQGR
jgi:hypothetical protein